MTTPIEPQRDHEHHGTAENRCTCGDDPYGPDQVIASIELPWVLPATMSANEQLPLSLEDEAFIANVIDEAYVLFGHNPELVAERTAHIAFHALWQHPRWDQMTRFVWAWKMLRDAPTRHGWPPRGRTMRVPPENFFAVHDSPEGLVRWLDDHFFISH